MMDEPEPFADYVGPTRTYGRMYGSLDFNDVSTNVVFFIFAFLKFISDNLRPYLSIAPFWISNSSCTSF